MGFGWQIEEMIPMAVMNTAAAMLNLRPHLSRMNPEKKPDAQPPIQIMSVLADSPAVLRLIVWKWREEELFQTKTPTRKIICTCIMLRNN